MSRFCHRLVHFSSFFHARAELRRRFPLRAYPPKEPKTRGRWLLTRARGAGRAKARKECVIPPHIGSRSWPLGQIWPRWPTIVSSSHTFCETCQQRTLLRSAPQARGAAPIGERRRHTAASLSQSVAADSAPRDLRRGRGLTGALGGCSPVGRDRKAIAATTSIPYHVSGTGQ